MNTKANAQATNPITQPVQAYCMKCREPRTMANPERVIMKNHRHAVRGACPECNTKMFRTGQPK